MIVNFYYSLLPELQLYFPTVFADHWFVFHVDIKYRHFIFLDSYYGKESNYHKEIDNHLVIKSLYCLLFHLVTFLYVVLTCKNKYVFKKQIAQFRQTWVDAGLRPLDFNTYGRAYPNVPQQKNG